MIRASKVLSGLFATTVLLVLLTGCGGGGEHGSAASETEASGDVEVAVIEVSPEAEAMLAQADLADGTEDHIVERCAVCNLGMDGSAEHAAKVGEYEMYFCSDADLAAFESNPEETILAMPQP